MAITKHTDSFYYKHEPISVGDTVEVVYSGYNTHGLHFGARLTVSSVTRGTYEQERVNGSYEYVYVQNLAFKGFSRTYSAVNFKKVPSVAVLALESNRPTIVQEIVETVEGTGAVVKNVGDPLNFDSLSAARVYTSNEITNSIRKDFTYRQFRIYQEVAVARAKKPEIEFA